MNKNISPSAVLNKKYIFFDIDWVIVSSVPFYAKLIRKILVDLWWEWIPEDISFMVWYSAEKTIWPFLAIEKLQDFHNLFEKRLIENHWEKHELTEWIIKLLKFFKEKWIKMAGVSSRSRWEFNSLFFHYPKLKDFFEITVSRDDVKMIKPDPEPINIALDFFWINASQAVMIWDSEHDLWSAIAVNMPFLWVCTWVLNEKDWQNKWVSYVKNAGSILKNIKKLN